MSDKLKATDELFDDIAKPSPVRIRSYDEIMGAVDRGWLIGDADHPVWLADASWADFGPEKSGKTYYNLEKHMCVSFGIPFHSLPVQTGPTIYVLAEGGLARIRKRIFALFNHYRPQFKDMGLPTDRDIIESHRFNLVCSAVNLMDRDEPTGFDELMRQIDLLKLQDPIAALSLDTWARMLAEARGHSSDAQVVTGSLRTCDAIRAHLGCTTNIIAHTPLGNDGRPKGMNELTGNIDGATQCSKTEEGADEVFSFTSAFQRHAENGFPMHMQRISIEPDGVLIKADAPANKKGKDGLKPRHREMMNKHDLMSLEDPAVPLDQWREACRPANQDAKARDAFRKQWDRDIEILTGKNVIRIDEYERASRAPADTGSDFGTRH
jgi:hypothetical protein